MGLVDKRRIAPSVRRIAAPEVERLLRLYRERYAGSMSGTSIEIARREHGVTVSYSFLKEALQAAGLVKKHRPRGRHRRRREPRACFGELLHIDGSRTPGSRWPRTMRATLIAVPDDATNRVLYAQFWDAESTQAVMTALGRGVHDLGLADGALQRPRALGVPHADGQAARSTSAG